MAEYRFHYKKGKLGYAKEHAAYILREDNYTSKIEELVYSESGNMNFFDGTSAIKFWEYADTYERANSVVYREMELNIPNEFNHEQAKELIKKFIEKEIGTGYPYTYAIHESYNKNDEKNLHCHLMFSERENDGIDRNLETFFKRANSKKPELGGAKKNREWQLKERLLNLRKSWEVETNILLEKNGFEKRVDCRSLRDIRKELLEKEMFDEAEKYNRTPLNISGKILYKVDRNIDLTEREKEKYENFLKAKKIRLEKIRESQYTDLKTEIEKIEKQNTKERALNIVTKGKYFKLKKDEYSILKKLKSYPENLNLLDRKNNITEVLNSIKIEWENKNKYIGIVEQLERNKERELNKAKEYFKEKFKEDYISREELKIRDKYKSYDILKVKIKLQTLLSENSEEKAMNIVTNYKFNKELIDVFNIQKNKKNIEEKYQEAGLYNQADLKVLKTQKEDISKQLANKINSFQKFIKSIDETQVRELLQKIENRKKLEVKILKEILFTEGKDYTNLDYEKERLMLLNKHSTLEKIYNKEIAKEEKNSKKIYSLAQDIVGIESLINKEYKEVREVKDLVKDNLDKIDKKISRNNKRIEVSEEVVKKIEVIKQAFNKKYNMTGIEIIAIGRLSKNEYWKLYKKQEYLRKEITQKEKAFSNMGIMAFGKNVIKKSIEIDKQKLEKLEIEEGELIKKYSKNERFKKEVEKLKGYYDIVQKNYKKIPYNLKEENRANYKLKSNVVDREKIVKTTREIPQQKLKKIAKGNMLNDLKNNINKILAVDSTEIYSNLDINLSKDKEYGWEM